MIVYRGRCAVFRPVDASNNMAALLDALRVYLHNG